MVKTFVVGDLVFAKVKGYPAWPARITSQGSGGKFRVFFYGTHETAVIKKSEIWSYTPDNKVKFEQANSKRKGYSEGLEEIENTPDVAPLETDDILTDSVLGVPDAAPSQPVVIKKPLKLEDGTPVSPKKGLKRTLTEAEDGKSPSNQTRKQTKTEVEEPVAASTPNTVSRSGRVIKPKKFGDDANGHQETVSKAAEKIIEEPRKVWVKLKSTGDLVEINLDRDKPERWESNTQKIQWELATARNALKFKEQVETGKYIPEEVRKKLEGQTDLTEEEKEICRRAAILTKRRKKLGFLQTESSIVDLDRSIKTALNSSNPQMSKCCELLTELMQLSIEPLMLLKQPDIILTIRKLRKYVGPADTSDYTEADKMKIVSGVKMITMRSGLCYDKFSRLFTEYNSTSQQPFYDYFQEELNKFKEQTKDWEESKLLSFSDWEE